MNQTRRQFIRASFLTAASLSIPVRSWGQVTGANNDIRMAVIGFNGRGKDHIEGNRKLSGVRIVALCDVDKDVLEREASAFRKRSEPIDTYTDIRKVLERKDIDVVSIATPNHWHSLMGIWTCQAGKDVYVEKPVSHNVWEGSQLVAAARKYNRIVEAGTQSRSNASLREALEWVRAGNLGKIKVSRGLCYKYRPSIGKVSGPQPIPASVVYDLWCGPSPKGPLMRSRLHYDWHWVWPTGNGDLGNQGIHQMDIARWALNKPSLSPRIMSVGGRLGYIDDGETPNTQMVVHDYGDALLIFEVRGLPSKPGTKEMDKYKGQSVGNIVECEGGWLSGTTAYDSNGKEVKKFKEAGESHHENFIKAVRSRKMKDLNAEILEGHLSSALCHTGNISYRLGKRAQPDEIKDTLKNNNAAGETFGRLLEHLAANGVDPKTSRLTVGSFLTMDPKTERFVSNHAANKMLTRHYRKPFVVPAKV